MTDPSIAMVSTWKTACGIATYTGLLCQGLEDAGSSIDVIPIDRSVTEDLSRAELAEHFEGMGAEAGRYDIVHVQHEHSFFQGAYGPVEGQKNLLSFLRGAMRGGTRVVVTFHSFPTTPSWPNGPLRAAARQAILERHWQYGVARRLRSPRHAAIAPTRLQRRLLIDSGIDRSAVHVVPMPAPSLRAGAPTPDAKRAVGLPADAIVLLVFGFVASHKGQHLAVEALRDLPENVHLVIAGGPHPHGDDPAHEVLLELLHRRRKISPRVHVTGWIPEAEVDSWFDAADICLAPYTERNLVSSASVMWALASNRPVIASKLPVFAELSARHDCMELVGTNSTRELASAVHRILEDPTRRRQLVDAAARQCSDASWASVIEAHQRLYR